MKLLIILFFVMASCKSRPDDPLIIPPNFSAKPDLKNIEKLPEKNNEKEIARIKDLLLKSE